MLLIAHPPPSATSNSLEKILKVLKNPHGLKAAAGYAKGGPKGSTVHSLQL